LENKPSVPKTKPLHEKLEELLKQIKDEQARIWIRAAIDRIKK
jgi:hypothetical protein